MKFCSPSSPLIVTIWGTTLFLLSMEDILLSKAFLSFLNLLHLKRQCEGVSFTWHTPHSRDVSKSIILLWSLSKQWPDLSHRISNNSLLVVFFSQSNLFFKPSLHIAGISSLYLWELESVHLLAHLLIVIRVFPFFKSDIVKSIFGGIWVAFFAATFTFTCT